MNTVQEVKAAVASLGPRARLELYKWLDDSKEVQEFRREGLLKELRIGIKQADRGQLLDSEVVFRRLDEKIRKQRLRHK